MKKSIVPIVMVALLAGLTTSGCQQPAPQVIQLEGAEDDAPSEAVPPSAAEPELLLRSYDIPEGYQERVFGMLQGLVAMHRDSEQPVGTVQMGPAGNVVVLAPESIHNGIAAMLKQLSERKGPPPETSSIEVEYWLVLAKNADETNASDLPEIADALQTVTKQQGPQEFTLLERASLQSADGDFAQSSGINANFNQRISSRGDELHGELEISTMRGQRIETRVQLKEGQTVILGQIGADPRLGTQRGEELRAIEEEVHLFYIVRAKKL